MPQCGHGPGTSLATPGHIGQMYSPGPPALAGGTEGACGALQQSRPAFVGADGSVISSL
jgi:hypothetical protein